jgi:hypothetical protein
MKVNGRLASKVGIEDFAYIKNDMLNIQLKEKYIPEAIGTRIVGIEGNKVNLDSLGIDVSAPKLVRYWYELEETRGFRLSDAARACLTAQVHNYAMSGMFPALPTWTNLVELVGLMHYLEHAFDHSEIRLKLKFNEAKGQLGGKARSKHLRFSNYFNVIQKGIPQLHRSISDFVSELRFAREVAARDLNSDLKEKGLT